MKVNLQPTLKNALVTIRPIATEDFEALYDVANDPLIWKLHQNPDRHELSIFKQFFKDALNSKGAFVIIDNSTKRVIGSSRYKMPGVTMEAVEIGWSFLSREYWGGVYNKSFKSLMITYAFQYFEYILFHIHEGNFRSQKAVEKLGGILLDKNGSLSYLHTESKTGLTYILHKTNYA